MPIRLLVLALASVGSLLPAAPGAAQTLDEIIARHIDARGGRTRIDAIRTIRVTRRVGVVFGGTLESVLLRKRPHFLRIEQSRPGQPPAVRGVDADGAWDVVQGKPARRPPAASAEVRDLEADFDGLLIDSVKKGHAVELIGKEVTAGESVYHLKVTLASGGERHVYLDATTFLERKQTGSVAGPRDRRIAVTQMFTDWREVDGVKFPFGVTEERDAPGQEFAIYVDKIEINPPLDDEIFRMPAAPPGG
jgi:hypothetical protein